ncbi:type II CAAX prenyl endopeptidase Rce1 family protein [Cyanobium sp. ATX 6A2]|uniref:CPBP family glutamic-type intramembrane protease n=1 Tax=Cyanobium sp. ATX 6A2 TaxID=2823700 RepID=UPI0020CB6F54|nr:CPBP family glutamic-type intramembrane protease [Cyanobium sp. ATX 6A2]
MLPFPRRLSAPLARRLSALFPALLAALLVAAVLLPALAPRPGHAAAGTPREPLPESSEELASRSPWTRPASYPLDKRPDPGLYRPSAEWIGRLILPSAEEAAADGDWVWIELEQAPAERQELLGERLRLRWADQPELQRLVRLVTTDISLGEPARQAAAAANVVPTRLDGRRKVGPLQSLAGARPRDDVIVRLDGVSVGDGELRIARPPVQTSGRWTALVTVLGHASPPGAPPDAAPEAASDLTAGSGADPDLVRVRHFNAASGAFDGPEERVRIPLLPPDRFGRRLFDPRGLAASALNPGGWLIHGAPAADGVFTVQSIEPRALLSLTPQRRISGTAAGLEHISRRNWGPGQLQRGSLHTTLLVPDRRRLDERGAADWAVGDRALLIHLFGGIGGADGEASPVPWTVPGHFSFGEAEVVRDPISAEPRLDLRYFQIYTNNPNGIVSGSLHASAYAGSLQRGWIGTRPISDVLVRVDGPALDAIALQAEILAARYRSGDGDGLALGTPSTSCVQDSMQALWIALQQLRQDSDLDDLPAAGRERRLQLADALDRLLTPFGRVRGDWRGNAEVTFSAGTGRLSAGDPGEGARSPFEASQRLVDVLLSWRSMLPRRAHDAMAREFLTAGLPLWVLRSNQIPGADPRLEPLAPTTVLGQLPVLGTLLQRLLDSLFPPLLPSAQGFSLLVLGVYSALALGHGLRSGFLSGPATWPPLQQLLPRAAGLLLLPALVEELIFRVALLPHPLEGVHGGALLAWIALSVGLFVLYHPLAARLWYQQARPLFHDPRFLVQCTLLGLACALVFVVTGSLWPPVLIHWLAVLVWLEPLQGRLHLQPVPVAAPQSGGASAV